MALIGALFDATHATGSGDILVNGQDIFDMPAPARSRTVAAVWQRPSIQLFRSTVIDEVRAPLDYQEVPATQATDQARDMLHLVGLDHVAEHRDPTTLSGGEQQRLALAAALAQQTPVLILDEATSALDTDAAQLFSQALDRARAERNVTIIAIDHRPDLHINKANRLLVLDDGDVALDGPPSEIFANHQAVDRLGLRTPATQTPEQATPPTSHTDTSYTSGGISLSGVDVHVRRAHILSDLVLDVPLGSVALLTGDNGVGKSTVL